ncbi:MAG: TrkH family potassium uptake protein [Azospirillaceae bacterium]
MFDYRPITFVIGLLLCIVAAAMLLPALVDLAAGHADWTVFAASAGVTFFVGAALSITSRASDFQLRVKEAFVLTTLSWLVIAAFGALPFAFSAFDLSYTDAFFESMSGVTTTGSTVIVGLDGAPPGLLIWRAMLQWLGGIGIIVMAISIMPMLRIGGMQLFRMESSEKSEKALPRAAQVASSIAFLYVALTLTCAGAYAVAGMPAFDAIAHSMTTVATGGFSTSDLSIGYYGSAAVDYVGVVFMISGSLPFVLYLRAVRGDVMSLLRDEQVRLFFTILATIVVVMALYLWATREQLGLLLAFRLAAFNVTSVMTGTGYATSDFGQWGPFAVSAMLFVMFIGGCAGSTTCGIKIFRFQVLYATTRTQLRKLTHPNGVFITYYNRKPVPESVSASVMAFFFVYMVSFAVLSAALGLAGLDFITAVSGAATAISNVGPGLGNTIGPTTTFASLPDSAKWLMSFGMLLGRLELFTVLILFAPRFWKS